MAKLLLQYLSFEKFFGKEVSLLSLYNLCAESNQPKVKHFILYTEEALLLLRGFHQSNAVILMISTSTPYGVHEYQRSSNFQFIIQVWLEGSEGREE